MIGRSNFGPLAQEAKRLYAFSFNQLKRLDQSTTLLFADVNSQENLKTEDLKGGKGIGEKVSSDKILFRLWASWTISVSCTG